MKIDENKGNFRSPVGIRRSWSNSDSESSHGSVSSDVDVRTVSESGTSSAKRVRNDVLRSKGIRFEIVRDSPSWMTVDLSSVVFSLVDDVDLVLVLNPTHLVS